MMQREQLLRWKAAEEEEAAEEDRHHRQEEEPDEGRIVEYIEAGVPKLGVLLQRLHEHERPNRTVWVVASQDARRFALAQAKFTYLWPELDTRVHQRQETQRMAERIMRDLALGAAARSDDASLMMSSSAIRANAKLLAALQSQVADLRATVPPERIQQLWISATASSASASAAAAADRGGGGGDGGDGDETGDIFARGFPFVLLLSSADQRAIAIQCSSKAGQAVCHSHSSGRVPFW